jgi:hypothetical protein
MNKKYILIITLLVIGAIVISAFSWVSFRSHEAKRLQAQNLTLYKSNIDHAPAQSLTSQSAADASAYRWNAAGWFYQPRHVLPQNLTLFRSNDAVVFHTSGR